MKTFRFAPIGVIDSGIGGLSLLKPLVAKFPNENYIYLADNLNMPYGNKSKKWLISRLKELINYLYDNFNVKLIILACNTASITAINEASKSSPVKVIGLNINTLIQENYKLLCTRLCSKGYENLNVYPCGKLASDIEENIFNHNTLAKKIKNTLNKANIAESNIILGCTHYELVASKFKHILPNKNLILPCKEFVKNFKLDLPNTSNVTGGVLMFSTLSTKSYIDKLWKIFKN